MKIITRLFSFFRSLYRQMRFRTKIYIIIMLSVFVPLVTALMLFNNYMGSALTIRSLETIANSFSQAYDHFSAKFDSLRKDNLLLLQDDNAREILQKYPYNRDILENRSIKDRIRFTIDFIEKKEDPVRLYVYVFDDYSQIIDNQYYFPFSAINQTNWYQKLLETSYRNMWIHDLEPALDKTISTGVNPLEGQETLSYLMRVCSVEKYPDTTAILRLDFSKDSIEETLRQMLTVQNSRAYLIAEDGSIVSEAYLGQDENDFPINIEKRSFNETVWTIQQINSSEYQMLSRSFKNHPWTLIMFVPSKEMGVLLNDWQWNSFLLLAVLSGVLIFAVSLLFSRNIVARISLVSSSMKTLINGEMKLLPEPRVMDEIGILIESYNYLTDELKMLISERFMAGANQKNAELKALQAQINPHFLYNTLELINYYASCNNTESVERVVLLLSKFYKLCLNRDREFCEIWQELELISCYYNIQNMRYEGKIHLTLDVPSELYQYMIPHIVIQPIVENAIIHGIMEKANRSGTITIFAQRESNDIIFAISDDGAGMSNERLQQITEKIEIPLDSGSKGSHYGLKNIHERLQGYYGLPYGLRFESIEDEGTTVYIRLPMR